MFSLFSRAAPAPKGRVPKITPTPTPKEYVDPDELAKALAPLRKLLGRPPKTPQERADQLAAAVAVVREIAHIARFPGY